MIAIFRDAFTEVCTIAAVHRHSLKLSYLQTNSFCTARSAVISVQNKVWVSSMTFKDIYPYSLWVLHPALNL